MDKSETCLPRDVVAQWSGYFFPSPDGSTNPQLPCQLNQLDASFKVQLQLQTQEWSKSRSMVKPSEF
ncbi:Casein kinase [Trichinella spiralis]|uniref:Casein kinase n=1 Tax=Trichinella spiralis TaxID=6334 RepID=A0ABR3KRJ3_TRISP